MFNLKLKPLNLKKSTLALIIIFLFFPVICWAFGLSVDPERINLENVPLGKKVAVSKLGGESLKLKIINKGGSLYTYTIEVFYTSLTAFPLKDGYDDIPDVNWVEPEKKEVAIFGNESAVVDIYLKIPQKDKYYNKKYQAVIEVKNKKNNPTEVIVLGCQIPIRFSTSSQEGKKISVIDNLRQWLSNLGTKKK